MLKTGLVPGLRHGLGLGLGLGAAGGANCKGCDTLPYLLRHSPSSGESNTNQTDRPPLPRPCYHSVWKVNIHVTASTKARAKPLFAPSDARTAPPRKHGLKDTPSTSNSNSNVRLAAPFGMFIDTQLRTFSADVSDPAPVKRTPTAPHTPPCGCAFTGPYCAFPIPALAAIPVPVSVPVPTPVPPFLHLWSAWPSPSPNPMPNPSPNPWPSPIPSPSPSPARRSFVELFMQAQLPEYFPRGYRPCSSYRDETNQPRYLGHMARDEDGVERHVFHRLGVYPHQRPDLCI